MHLNQVFRRRHSGHAGPCGSILLVATTNKLCQDVAVCRFSGLCLWRSTCSASSSLLTVPVGTPGCRSPCCWLGRSGLCAGFAQGTDLDDALCGPLLGRAVCLLHGVPRRSVPLRQRRLLTSFTCDSRGGALEVALWHWERRSCQHVHRLHIGMCCCGLFLVLV